MADFEFTPEELDSLLGGGEQETPPVENKSNESTDTTEQQHQDKIDQTKAFAKRLAESTNKAVVKERENIAKQMGFESYDAMIKSKENKIIEDNGLDAESSSKAINEIVKIRLDSDPRLKELEELRSLKVQQFGKEQLAELTALTNGEITSFSQVPQNVIDLWKTCGSLKKAYLQIEGENLIVKMRNEQSKGSTDHLQTAGKGTASLPNNKRTLTEKEKSVWKLFNPSMSDDELNKMLVDK